MSIFDILAEQRIADAIRRGEFDNLPGAGRPLDLSEDPFVPAERRMVNRILKNAGVTPPEIGLRKQIVMIRQALSNKREGPERDALRSELGRLLLELAALRGR